MSRVAILNVVGLTPRCLLSGHMPQTTAYLTRKQVIPVQPILPAVTCSMQSACLTGRLPAQTGIVANGWYDRTLAEVQFWKQSNHLVSGEKLWEKIRRDHPDFTTAKLFWWYNMYSSAEYSLTPRPIYKADGGKVFDIYSHPSTIRDRITADLGEFPFPAFWGPQAGIESSRWIAASAKWIEEKYWPNLSLIYLPHLDYNFQRLGPDDAACIEDMRQIDAVVGDLVQFCRNRAIKVVILSEYGITPVDRPIHLNRLFREKGWIAIREELGLELLDAGASKVFAVADHQVAHIYINDRSLTGEVKDFLDQVPGIQSVIDGVWKAAAGLDHPRSGEIVVVADARSWFTYYYWMDDAVAPDFARCVDIHRKPGYDPVELFLDPALKNPKLEVGRRLLKKKMGFRMLMDVIPLDATLVRGSHGRVPEDMADWPVLGGDFPELEGLEKISALQVHHELLEVIRRGIG